MNAGKDNEKIYYKGYGSEPFLYCSSKGQDNAFGGGAFVVESRADLEYAARTIPTASKIHELVDTPGGGECVTIKDPVDGWPLHLVYGQEQKEVSEPHSEREYNFVGFFLQMNVGKRNQADKQTASGEASFREQIPKIPER